MCSVLTAMPSAGYSWSMAFSASFSAFRNGDVMKGNNILFFSLILAALSSCGPGSRPDPTDTPTSGEVNIVVDESYSLLFDGQIAAFESVYNRAKIHVRYLPESEALQYLISDSCKVIVINRDLTKEERSRFESNNLYPISTRIAEDAVAFVVHPENTDTIFTPDLLRKVLNGEITDWSQIDSASTLGKINAVFDNKGSANARFIHDSLLGGKPFSEQVFAVKSNPEVVAYVNQNKNALGILSVNWISDPQDTVSRGFLKKVKVVGFRTREGGKAYKPYQGYIKTKEYPFCRDVYMINRQTRAGLGMGFVSYVAGEKGQLIILKSGLIPAIAPVRIIEVK